MAFTSEAAKIFHRRFRSDILILITYQLCHAYTTQQLFPILLNYVPPVGCFDGHCTTIRGKCYEGCATCPDVCSNITIAAHEECVKDNNPYFKSAAMEYQIYCRPFFKSISAASVQYTGVLVGNFIVGYAADRFGRRFVLLVTLLLGIPELFLGGIINNLPVYYILRFAVGMSVAGTMSVGWTYCSEMISPKHRFKLRTVTSYSLVNQHVGCIELVLRYLLFSHTPLLAHFLITFVETSLGRVFMVGLAHAAGEWRLASFLYGGVCIFTLLLLLFLPESIIWLKRKGYTERAKNAQKKLDLINGAKSEDTEIGPRIAKNVPLLDVIRDAKLRVGFFVLCVMWFFGAFCEYSIDLNGDDMSKNLWAGQYLSGALASIIRLSFGIADGYFPWLGRRKVFIIGMSVCTAASGILVLLLYLGHKGTTLYLVVYLTAYNSIALIWEPNFVCAAELMPTDVRATTTAFLGIISRVSIIIASTMIVFKTIHEPVIMWMVLGANLINLSITSKLLQDMFVFKDGLIGWIILLDRKKTKKKQQQETKNCNLENIGLNDDAHVKPLLQNDIEKRKESK